MMLRHVKSTKARIAFVLFFVLTVVMSITAEADMREGTLVLGKVTENPKKHYKTLKPMVDYVASHMKDLGIKEGKVLMARDNKQMISYIRQRKIDWITETVFSSIIYQEKAGVEFLLRKWKKGVPEYYTILFTRKDAGINDLADLKGKTIAFEDAGSTSAYYIPASVLIHQGFDLVQLSTPREKPPADMIGYVFSGQEINTTMWVHKGLVEAGAFNNLDWEKDDFIDKRLKADLKLFYRTKPFPRALELVRGNVDPQIKNRLKEILLQADKDPSAKQALKAYQKTKKFDEIDENVLAGIQEARTLLKIVKDRLE